MADRGKKFGCLKYFMMSSNAFGVMIGIFLVLFGMAYPEESFPGGYRGKETAGIAGVFIFFTLIGYCGAHHQKIYFLVLYSIIILTFISGNIVLWAVNSDILVLDPESRTVYAVSGLFLVLMVVGVVLSWNIRRVSLEQQAASQPMTTLSKNNNNHQVMMHPSTSTSFVQIQTMQNQRQLPGPMGQMGQMAQMGQMGQIQGTLQ